jgi:hypothetical protein
VIVTSSGPIGVPHIVSFSASCSPQNANGHSYNVFTLSWTTDIPAKSHGWTIRQTTTSSQPSPGDILAGGSSGQSSSVWIRNDAGDNGSYYWWIRYDESTDSWFPLAEAPLQIGNPNLSMCAFY